MRFGSWLYASTSELSTAEAIVEIDMIVTTSRERNASLDVTGALLFSGVSFVQFLEGPSEAIQVLRGAIEADTRHRDLFVFPIFGSDIRRFEQWSLAYTGASRFLARTVQKAIDDTNAHPLRSGEGLVQLLRNFSPLA